MLCKKLQISDFLAERREKIWWSTAVIQNHKCSSELLENHPPRGQDEGISTEGYFQLQQLRPNATQSQIRWWLQRAPVSSRDYATQTDINRKSIGFDFIIDAASQLNILFCGTCFLGLFSADPDKKAKWTSNINLPLPAMYCQPERLF